MDLLPLPAILRSQQAKRPARLPVARCAAYAVNVIFRRELQDSEDPDLKRSELIADYEATFNNPYQAAELGLVDEVMSVLDARKRPRAEVVWATNTLNGNPVCAAAGCAALDVLAKPGVYDRLHQVGSRLRKGIVDSGMRHGFAVQAPGEDAVFGVRFTDRKPLRTWTSRW